MRALEAAAGRHMDALSSGLVPAIGKNSNRKAERMARSPIEIRPRPKPSITSCGAHPNAKSESVLLQITERIFDTIEGQNEAPFHANGKGLLTILLISAEKEG